MRSRDLPRNIRIVYRVSLLISAVGLVLMAYLAWGIIGDLFSGNHIFANLLSLSLIGFVCWQMLRAPGIILDFLRDVQLGKIDGKAALRSMALSNDGNPTNNYRPRDRS